MSDFKSWRSFWDFNHEVRRKFRYVRTPDHEDFLKAVAETCHSRKVVLREGSILWRAQLGMSIEPWMMKTAFTKLSVLILPNE